METIINAWQEIAKFFANQSALANFIQIFMALLALGGLILRGIRRRAQQKVYPNVTSWVHHKYGDVASSLPKSCIEKIRIAIIDDKPADFPVSYIRSLGYAVDVFEQYSLSQADQLAKYELVVLDIANVVEEDPKRGGLDLLLRVLELTPRPLVIAVSGKRYDPTVTEYFKRADKVMKKPVKQVDFEKALLALLSSRISLSEIAKQIDESLNKLPLIGAAKDNAIQNVILTLSGQKQSHEILQELATDNKKAISSQITSFLSYCKNYDSSRTP